ncbi:MAG: glycosyltransferase family 9 protein [Planctomycetes bacterium]|nr:glycosyltransferase family 9 protein [Planctomycetota bacterium]
MNPGYYQSEWAALREADPDVRDVRALADRLALAFLDDHYYRGVFDADAIELLCEMGVHFEDEPRRCAAAAALFGIVVEGLCDDFEPLQAEAYNNVMSCVLSHCRRWPGAAALDRDLSSFALESFQDIYRRSERLRCEHQAPFAAAGRPVEKVLLLSRVTLGADVAITSVLVQRLADRFAQADLVIVGGPKLGELFGAHPRLRVRPVDYPRRGGMLERFAVWQAVLAAVRDEIGGLPAGAGVIVDPDSRLSQLGVLPVAQGDALAFFNSRQYDESTARLAMAELANRWADSVFGPGPRRYPRVWLPSEPLRRGRAFCDRCRAGGRRLVCVSFGVGGNDRKRVGERFERLLIAGLLAEPHTCVLLDSGAGQVERARTAGLLAEMGAGGHAVCRTTLEAPEGPDGSARLIAVETGIGEFAAVIGSADEYIGYDSAGQHLAAAQAVPCYTVFAGTNDTRFVRRWRAFGPGEFHVIHADTLRDGPGGDEGRTVARVLDRRREACGGAAAAIARPALCGSPGGP